LYVKTLRRLYLPDAVPLPTVIIAWETVWESVACRHPAAEQGSSGTAVEPPHPGALQILED
ncbi:MAG TPA: hypothetical protein VIJ38_06540, partial [Acidobacteriaceae bacterium]